MHVFRPYIRFACMHGSMYIYIFCTENIYMITEYPASVRNRPSHCSQGMYSQYRSLLAPVVTSLFAAVFVFVFVPRTNTPRHPEKEARQWAR